MMKSSILQVSMNIFSVSYQSHCLTSVSTNVAERDLMCFIKVTWSYNGGVISSPQVILNSNSLITLGNSALHRTIDMGIIKLDVLDHVPIFLIVVTEMGITPEDTVQNTKRLINNETKQNLKMLYRNWHRTTYWVLNKNHSAYDVFSRINFSLWQNSQKDCGYGKIENTKKPVDNKGNSKIFKNRANAIW